MRLNPAIQQTIHQREACRALLVASWAIRFGTALHDATGWVLDHLQVLSRRQLQHANDLAVLGGLEPIPEGPPKRR